MRPTPPKERGGQLPSGAASVPAPEGLSDIMAMATGRGTVKLMDMRSSWQVRVVELTPDQWRAVWPKIEQALAVAEGRHPAQTAEAPGDGAAD